MKRREIIIPAVASAAAALVSGVAVRLYYKVKYGMKLLEMNCELTRLNKDYEDLNRRVDIMEACELGFDPDDFILEEDNEDE